MNKKGKAALLALCAIVVHIVVFFVFSSSLRYSEKVWGRAAEGYAVAGLGVLMSAILWMWAFYTACTLARNGSAGLVGKLIWPQYGVWIAFVMIYSVLVYAMCGGDMEGNAPLEQLKLNMTMLVDGGLCVDLSRHMAK